MAVKLIQQIDAACCPSFADAPLSEEAAEVLAAALRIVADPTRLRLLSLIATRAGAEGCVCELTEPLGLSQPTVSHHLKVLTSAGILEREKRGRWVYFRIDREPLIALQAALAPGPFVRYPDVAVDPATCRRHRAPPHSNNVATLYTLATTMSRANPCFTRWPGT